MARDSFRAEDVSFPFMLAHRLGAGTDLWTGVRHMDAMAIVKVT
jgi:hypothetical protein